MQRKMTEKYNEGFSIGEAKAAKAYESRPAAANAEIARLKALLN